MTWRSPFSPSLPPSFLVYRWSAHQHIPCLAAALVFQQPPTCASAASAWGSQKVISISRYNAMATVSTAVRAGSWAARLDVEGAQAQVAVRLQGDACPAPQPGRGPGGSGSRLTRSPAVHAAPQCRRGGAQHTPGYPVPGAHGRASARSAGACACIPHGRPADAPPRRLRLARKPSTSVAMVCSSACMSSRMASATRPDRVYAAPKPQPSRGTRLGGPLPGDAYGPFEQEEGPVQVAFAEGQQANPPTGTHEAPGMSDRLGNPQPFVPERTALDERAELGMAHSEGRAREITAGRRAWPKRSWRRGRRRTPQSARQSIA